MKRIHQFKIRWPVHLCISVNKLNANYFYSELLAEGEIFGTLRFMSYIRYLRDTLWIKCIKHQH